MAIIGLLIGSIPAKLFEINIAETLFVAQLKKTKRKKWQQTERNSDDLVLNLNWFERITRIFFTNSQKFRLLIFDCLKSKHDKKL